MQNILNASVAACSQTEYCQSSTYRVATNGFLWFWLMGVATALGILCSLLFLLVCL